MTLFHLTILIILFSISAWHQCLAEIQWLTPTVEHTATYDERELSFDFPLINRGKLPVTFKQFATSCGCAEVSKDILRTYQPGEKGLLRVRYEIGTRTGRRIETIFVETDEPQSKSKPYELRVIAVMPELLKQSPGFLYWKTGELAEQREMSLVWTGPSEAEVTLTDSSYEGWQVKLMSQVTGKSWRLLVKPLSTQLEQTLQIRLHIMNKQTGKKEVTAVALVQTP